MLRNDDPCGGEQMTMMVLSDQGLIDALAAFPINSKWPAQHPDRLQLYSPLTPNGVKVSIMLEELGLPYEAHKVRFDTQDQLSPEFLSLNPNNKIPAIIDPNGPSRRPLALFRIRRDPRLPGGKDQPVALRRPGHPL